MATLNGVGSTGSVIYKPSCKTPAVKPLPHSLPPELWTSEMDEVLKTKKRAYRRYKAHGCEDSQTLFRACRSRLRWLMKQAVTKHMETLDEDGKIELLDWQSEVWGKRRKILQERPEEEKRLKEAEGWVEVERPARQPVYDETVMPAYQPSYATLDVPQGNAMSRLEQANRVDPVEVHFNTKSSDDLERHFGKD